MSDPLTPPLPTLPLPSPPTEASPNVTPAAPEVPAPTGGVVEPFIIPRGEHPVSRQLIDREALKVMYRLRDAGFLAYLVGGGVRDLFLGKTPKDFDVSTDARPGQLRKIFRNSRIIGRRFQLVQVFYPGNKIIEVSTFRRQAEHDLDGADTVLPADNTFGSPAEDAFRRDLTINALFYEIEGYTVIDYTGGVRDLRNRIVRIIGEPERRIVRDPVRMLRAIRHAARADFVIEPRSWEAIRGHVDKLRLCPASRIHDELMKDLQGGASRAWCELAIRSGVFRVLFPFYDGLLDGEEGNGTRRRLLDLLGVVDHLAAQGQKLPTYLLFALLFVPWAEKTAGLTEVRSLREAFELSRQVRETLHSFFASLNVKRHTQDEATRCLASLPLLVNNETAGGWPKWLKKKSYFGIGSAIFKINRQASGGEPARIEVPAAPPASDRGPDLPVRVPERERGEGGGGKRPAFNPKGKGGIFGLRRRRG